MSRGSVLGTLPFRLMLITRSPEIAQLAVRSGVDWIFADLEVLGKAERQRGRDTVISRHSLADVRTLRDFVSPGSLLVRINPWHAASRDEVEAVLDCGADMIMLPMFRGPAEVEQLVRAVKSRASLILLMETAEAARCAAEIAAVGGIDRIHIGLNDLHIALGKRFMFELLADGTVDRIADVLRARGMPFGVGGVARIGEGLLPAEYILGEHVRLGSTAAILSRTFHREASTLAELEQQLNLAEQVAMLRRRFALHAGSDSRALEENHGEVVRRVSRILAGTVER